MSTYTQTSHQLVFSTKRRLPVLAKSGRDALYRYTYGILENKKCHVYRIGGVEDHIHILTSIHPSIALADLLRDLKTSMTGWIKDSGVFPGFPGWQDGYGGFAVSVDHRSNLIDYIMNQEEHHRHETSLEEFRRLLRENGIEFDERYLE
jgi:putative transposase